MIHNHLPTTTPLPTHQGLMPTAQSLPATADWHRFNVTVLNAAKTFVTSLSPHFGLDTGEQLPGMSFQKPSVLEAVSLFTRLITNSGCLPSLLHEPLKAGHDLWNLLSPLAQGATHAHPLPMGENQPAEPENPETSTEEHEADKNSKEEKARTSSKSYSKTWGPTGKLAMAAGAVSMMATRADGLANNIADVTSLNQINKNQGYITYHQTQDIDGSKIASSIGTEDNPFRGVYDGQHHKITGLKQCLFGEVDGATIKNLRIEDTVITTKSRTHSLLVCSSKSGNLTLIGNVALKNIHIEAEESASAMIGNLEGRMEIVNASVSDSTITIDASDASSAWKKINAGFILQRATNECADGIDFEQLITEKELNPDDTIVDFPKRNIT